MNKFNQACAVITGAGSGIGRHLAVELAKLGANLALSDINTDALAETASLIGTGTNKVHTQSLDVSDKAAVFAYADTVQNEFGKVNLVINNAGVALTTGTFDHTTLEEFEWLMSINFSGVLYGTKAFLPYLKQAQWGHIVNISSLFGIIGVPGQSAYNASKFAVRGMTEALRQELDETCPTVSCTSVHPGGVKTNIMLNSRNSEQPINDQEFDFVSDAEEFERIAKTTAQSAALQIIRAVEKDRRRLLIGADAKLLDWIQRHFPNHYQRVFRILADFMRR